MKLGSVGKARKWSIPYTAFCRPRVSCVPLYLCTSHALPLIHSGISGSTFEARSGKDYSATVSAKLKCIVDRHSGICESLQSRGEHLQPPLQVLSMQPIVFPIVIYLHKSTLPHTCYLLLWNYFTKIITLPLTSYVIKTLLV